MADLLKTKAGTTYVNNELAKKPNKKYVNSVVSSSLQDYYTKAEIDDNYVLRTDLPSDNALAHYADLADYYTKTQVDNIVENAVASTKPKVSIQAEQNGSITNNAYKWSFGENNPHYGLPCPSNGRILCGAISATAGNNAPGEMKVAVVVNGAETGSAYMITKPNNQFSFHFSFSTPLELQAADRINFCSKTTNASVTHAVISLIIELDI